MGQDEGLVSQNGYGDMGDTEEAYEIQLSSKSQKSSRRRNLCQQKPECQFHGMVMFQGSVISRYPVPRREAIFSSMQQFFELTWEAVLLLQVDLRLFQGSDEGQLFYIFLINTPQIILHSQNQNSTGKHLPGNLESIRYVFIKQQAGPVSATTEENALFYTE